MTKYQPRQIPCGVLLLLILAHFSFSSRIEANDGEGLIFEFDFSRVNFAGDTFKGDTAHFGLTLAYAPNADYEIGLTYTDNFLFSPSIDEGPNLAELEDVETKSKLLYLRRNWHATEKTTGFVLIGYAKTEIKSKQDSVCFFFCGEFIDVNTRVTSNNKESGLAWGAGIEWQRTRNRKVSLKYIDYSDSDFEFTGLHLGFRTIFEY